MKTTDSYKEWSDYARELDVLEGKEDWKAEKESDMYDYKLIEHRLQTLRGLGSIGELNGLMLLLQAGLHRKLAGIHHQTLYERSNIGTKVLIEEYIQEVVKQLRWICDNDFPEFSTEKKLRFFHELRQSFGRSALCLSGGAALGMYHFGVIKALLEQGLLPRIISGSSAGSLIASIVAVSTDEELAQVFLPGSLNLDAFEQTGSFKRKLYRLLTKGVLMDIRKLEDICKRTIGDITFKEAYEKTNRILNITVASTSKFELPYILNYLTSPNVLIWSAACASCALSGLYEPVELLAKNHQGKITPYHFSYVMQWTDGSVESDLPMNRLAEIYNVNHFIVSQVNPHVLPIFWLENKGIFHTRIGEMIKTFIKSEIHHRTLQLAELGILPKTLQFVVTQRYEGDITIIPEVTLDDYTKILSNPSEEFRYACTVKGQRSTWPHMTKINCSTLIERTLETCVTKLRTKIKKSPSELTLYYDK